jgi:hypothetical protein
MMFFPHPSSCCRARISFPIPQIEKRQLAIDGKRRPNLRGLNAFLNAGQKVGVGLRARDLVSHGLLLSYQTNAVYIQKRVGFTSLPQSDNESCQMRNLNIELSEA